MLLPFNKHYNLLLRNLFPVNFVAILILTLFTSIIFQSLVQANTTSSLINNNPLAFDTLSTSDGLSQSYVYSINQDNQGFIWIATEDGLDRYDGNEFVHYRHQAADENSIADNIIRKIYVDNANTIWVGTENGLSRYNAQLDNFDNFYNISNDSHSLKDNVIWDIYQDNSDNLWVSTQKGLHKYSTADQSFDRIRIRGFEEQLKEVKTIFQDKNNNYWIGTYDNGIFLLNEKLSYAVSLQAKNKWQLAIDASALFDLKMIENDYWLATNNGVYIVSADYHLKKHLHTEQNNAILSNKIRAIEKINDNQVWLATENGLNSINLLDYSIQSYQSTFDQTSLSENWLMDIYLDQSGKVWLGSYGGGINVYNPLSTKFKHSLNSNNQYGSTVESFAETSDGTIWFSTQQEGLYQLKTNGDIRHIETNIQNRVSKLITDKNDNLWLSTANNKLYRRSYKDNKFTEDKQWFEHASYSMFHLLTLINNDLWFLDTEGLLTSYHLETKQITRFSLENKKKLTALGFEGTKYIWLTTESNELYQFNLSSKEFTKQAINTTKALESKQTVNINASAHWIWLGSYSQGITLINKANNNIKHFDETNLLSNNFIADILIDENENAWLASNKGISVINPISGEVQNFDHDFAIKNSEFISFSSLLSSSKLMFFGSTNGFYQLEPSEILQIKQKLSPLILTNVFIANKKIKVKSQQKTNINTKNTHKNFSLEKQVNHLDKLTLTHNQSPFSIEFISPNAKLPSQIRYRYRLVGLEENWIEAGLNNQRATYTNLNAGDYSFEVQAYDLYNPAVTKSTNLNIRVMPPWWLSSSAIMVYTLISLLFITYILQQVRHKRLYNLQIKQSEERLKLSLWGSGDEMWDWNIATGKIFRSNIWGILDFPQDGTRNIGGEHTNLHQHDIPRVQQALTDHFAQKTDHFESTYRVKDKNNRWIWVLDRGKIVERDENDNPKRMTGTLKDISQIKKAEERLKLFAKCIENISDAVIIYDKQFVIVDVNKAFQRITGKNKVEMLGKSLSFNQYPKSFSHDVKKHLLTKGTWNGEVENIKDNGQRYLTDLNIDVIRDENQGISHFVGVFSDITKRKETEVELRKLANNDTLTGLPNRSYFQANQTRLVKNKIPHALLVFDLDNFKKINDSLGHQVGDILLCKVAQRILQLGSKQDSVYRLGGDEFSILIENTNDIHSITTLANKILQTIAIPLKLRNQEIVLYSSIGIVLYPEDGISPQELLKNADTAMYHAKGLGGNKYQFFNESMNKKAVKRLQIESLIRQGLKDDLFSVFYQPKIEIATGKIAGMEALVRFETPKKGLISPVVFIPVSEETGQIIDIGEVVLRKACFATKKWVDLGLFDGRIAVNLSAVQFTQPNLVHLIASILQESKLPAKYLELEITEGTVMDSPQQAIDTMLKIRAMGIHLSLDDFGTGYSSLAYLKKFPLNTLKIDKAFVDDIEHSEQGRNMVATIVTIAHNLDMHVVAEGVETTQQLSFLSGLKCEQLQGYLYSKPLAEQDFKKYLLAHQITDKSTNFNKS